MSSAASNTTTAPPAVFARYPAALALPSADPSALAVEAMLRMTGTRYTRTDARLDGLRITVPPDSATSNTKETVTAAPPPRSDVSVGLLPCLQRLSSEVTVDSVPSECAPAALCVELLTTRCLFPAFLFATHYDPIVYQTAVKKAVEPKVASVWESLRGTYRAHVLRANPFFYTAEGSAIELTRGKLSLTALSKLNEVKDEVCKALGALELLLRTAKSAAADLFFLGTARPTHVDALAYAAASCFLHANVADDSFLGRLQLDAHQSYPILLQYVERLRHLFFEADSGTYCLKPREKAAAVDPSVVMAEEMERQYRSGRTQTLWWTGLFASVYFLLVNVDLLVALIADVEEEEAEEREGAAEAEGPALGEQQQKRGETRSPADGAGAAQ